jgi:hypothetical protein
MKKNAGARKRLRSMCILLIMFATAAAIVVLAVGYSPTCSEGSSRGTAIGGVIRLRGCP